MRKHDVGNGVGTENSKFSLESVLLRVYLGFLYDVAARCASHCTQVMMK